MDTYTELSNRLDSIAMRLGTTTSSESDTLKAQIATLRTQLQGVYEANSELKTLNRIMRDLKLWKDMELYPETKLELSEDQVDSEEKRLLINMKYPSIIEAYNNLNDLSRMDLPRLINHIDSVQDKTFNYEQNLSKIAAKKPDIVDLNRQFHQLVVKNMLVFEKYLALMIRENKFWLEVEAKVLALNKRVNAYAKSHGV